MRARQSSSAPEMQGEGALLGSAAERFSRLDDPDMVSRDWWPPYHAATRLFQFFWERCASAAMSRQEGYWCSYNSAFLLCTATRRQRRCASDRHAQQ